MNLRSVMNSAAILILLGLATAPASASVRPENAQHQADSLALLPPACRNAAPSIPPADKKPVSAIVSRITGEVICTTGTNSAPATVGASLTERCTIKTGQSSWCEVKAGGITIRCWYDTECLIDTANQAVHIKSGSVIVRKSGSGEMLVTAGGQSLLLEGGVVRVEVAKGVARILD